MNRPRVVVWGLGRHARHKLLPAAMAVPSLELYGVCSRDPRTVAEASYSWNCRGWTDPDAMLADPDVDVVYVATPIGLHREHGRAVLAAGKHLWCEKPLTMARDETTALIETSRTKGLSVGEGHMYLHHPQFLELREQVAAGRVGAVTSIACRFGIPPLESPGFRTDAALGGGALFDVGCYPVSALHALFPDMSFRLLHARVLSRDGAQVDTDGEALFEFAGGATARLEWRINTAYRNEIDIWGDAGSVFTDKIFSKPATYVPTFAYRDRHGVETVVASEPADHFALMLRDFVKIMDDRNASEIERQRIVERAVTLDQIASRAADS
jgi:NDP-hexose-3-ketoreductase